MPELLVVATPIGNLNDLTPRAAEALERADLIAAEDTRVTMKLLNHLNLKKPMVSCHRHNEEDRSGGIVERMLAEDLTVALTCDAGTPAVSDPGQFLVDAAWRAGIRVTPVCGASATVTALSASGFDSREFGFFGFLPREKKALAEKLKAIRDTGLGCAVLYESPHRVVELTRAIAEALPDARLLVCCDLTKKYELLLRGAPGDVLSQLEANPNVEKGEYCLVLELPTRDEQPPEPEAAPLPAEMRLLERMLAGESLSEAARALSGSLPRNELYRAKLAVKAFLEECEL